MSSIYMCYVYMYISPFKYYDIYALKAAQKRVSHDIAGRDDIPS